MIIPDSDFYQSRNPDLARKKIFFSYHFFATNIIKLKIIFLIFEQVKNYKNYSTFYPKVWHSDIKNMGLGSGIRKTYSGSRIQGQQATRSRSRIPNTGSILPKSKKSNILKKYTGTGNKKFISISKKN